MGEVVERLSEIIHEMCSEHEAEVLSLDIQLNQVHLLVEGDPQFGIHRLFVDPRNTSQICSGCGAVTKKELDERWHSCECGCLLDRDHNAALNILWLGRSYQGAQVT